MRLKTFILLCIFMALYVPLGTLLHESGHILLAQLLGYKTQLHYASMDWYNAALHTVSNAHDSFIITLGGNMLLDLISIASLATLLTMTGRIRSWLYWVQVFLSMLIYRHILLTLIGIAMMVQGHPPVSFGRDESEIASYLHLPGLLLGWGLFLVSLASLYLLLFRVVKNEMRRHFFVAMCIGCPVGYGLWMLWLGPLILP